MNTATISGRLTDDPKEFDNLTRFTLAVQRRKEDHADFISCICFGKTMEIVNKYCKKGMKVGVTGRIQTGCYMSKNGANHYSTDIVVNELEFLEKKKEEKVTDGFQDLDDTGLPFYG